MAYNTNLYLLLFLPVTAAVYELTPRAHRWKTLLLASILFFWSFSKILILWTVATALITWYGGIRIQRVRDRNAALPKETRLKSRELKRRTGRIVRLAVFLVVLILAGLKYTNFAAGAVTRFLNFCGADLHFGGLQIAVPIGISFYSLQAVGYLLDVHWGHFRAEENPAKLFLFLIFFPTLMEGPIMRWEDMKDQLFAGTGITVDSISQGCIRIGWGLFKRMIISDRMNAMVLVLFNPNKHYEGAMIVLTAIVVTVQLYMEFSGTIDIVIGSARIFGIRLTENFRQPFLAESAAEFWRRWHITLGVWFKDYIFYPVSMSGLMKKWNKFGRKHCGTYLTNLVISAIALFPVWILNGLWHGPQETYILYGIYYFLILLTGVAIEPFEKKALAAMHVRWEAPGPAAFRRIRTFIIIITGETLFRCTSWAQFAGMVRRLFTGWADTGFWKEVNGLGMDRGDLLVIVLGCVFVFMINAGLEQDPDMLERIPSLSRPKRWGIYYGMILAILIFGAYGSGYQAADLIYAGF